MKLIELSILVVVSVALSQAQNLKFDLSEPEKTSELTTQTTPGTVGAFEATSEPIQPIFKPDQHQPYKPQRNCFLFFRPTTRTNSGDGIDDNPGG